jgi:23S rRNA pseudouridine1911/1915/1917 synthase
VTRVVELCAGEAEAGRRLDVALAAHDDVGSRAAAQRLIDAGRVLVDGEPRPKRHRLAPGEVVTAELTERQIAPDAASAGAGVPYEVAYEDDHLLVVDKPAGVVVHPAPGHPEGTLAQALAGRAAGGPDPWRPGIVHRLDRDTSGLMVVAKSERVHRALQELIRARRVERIYLALVEGRPDARRGTIDAPIGRDRDHRTLISTRTDHPRPAVTHFRQLEGLEGSQLEGIAGRRLGAPEGTTLLQVRLETGRTHQIRAHLAAIGHPVCGDSQYGGGLCGSRLGLTRQFLHSARLGFEHPVIGKVVNCESKLPADLRRSLGAALRDPVPEGPDGG